MRFKTETKMRIQALKYRDGLENHQIAKEMGISQNMIWQYVESLEKQIKAGEITVADIVSSVNALKIDGPKRVSKQEVDEMLSEQGMTQQEISENAQALDEALAKAGEVDGGKEMATPIKRNYGGRPKMIVEIDDKPMNNLIKKGSPELDIITEYMLNSLLTRDDITKILDASAELKNCGYTTEEIMLTLNELKYFSDEIDKVGKQIGMSAEYLKDIKDPLADFRKPAKNPSPEFSAEQLRKMLADVTEVKAEQMIGIADQSSKSNYVLTIMSHIYDELVAGKLALKYYLMEEGVHELQFVEVRKK